MHSVYEVSHLLRPPMPETFSCWDKDALLRPTIPAFSATSVQFALDKNSIHLKTSVCRLREEKFPWEEPYHFPKVPWGEYKLPARIAQWRQQAGGESCCSHPGKLCGHLLSFEQTTSLASQSMEAFISRLLLIQEENKLYLTETYFTLIPYFSKALAHSHTTSADRWGIGYSWRAGGALGPLLVYNVDTLW